jgi:hypothetical protein
MKIRELRSVLDQLRRLYSAGRANAAEKDLVAIAHSLQGHDDKSVEDYVRDTRQELARADEAKSRVDRDSNGVVERFVRRLIDAETDASSFYPIRDEMIADGRVKLAEADAIARSYTGFKAKYKKRQAAFDDIEKVFVERARFKNKMNALS